jgi:hypothetical protein
LTGIAAADAMKYTISGGVTDMESRDEATATESTQS